MHMSKSEWVAVVTVNNNTSYYIDMDGTGDGGPTTIQPGKSFTWTSSSVNNAKSLKFYHVAGQYYMQGGVSYGPESGVYVDRGWMAKDDQSIKMTAVANGATFVQTDNGGTSLLPWNGFEEGGNITLTFDPE